MLSFLDQYLRATKCDKLSDHGLSVSSHFGWKEGIGKRVVVFGLRENQQLIDI
jgi:hypothetical protein